MNRRTFLLQLVGAVSAGELLARLPAAPVDRDAFLTTIDFRPLELHFPHSVADDDYVILANEEPYGPAFVDWLVDQPLERQLFDAAEREFRRQAKLAGDKTMRELLAMYG